MKNSLRRCFTCCLTASAICCALFIAIVVIAWLIVHPQDPKFQVDSFSVSNFTVGNDSKVSFAADVRLTAQNPNNYLSLSFGSFVAKVYYKSSSSPVARTTMPPFSLGKMSKAPVNASFDAVALNFTESDILGFQLKLACKTRLEKSLWMMSWKNYLKVYCGLFVGIPSNGTQLGALAGGPKKKCKTLVW